MKLITKLVFLLLVTSTIAANGQLVDKKKRSLRATYVSLTGESLSKGNSVSGDGNVHQVNIPLLWLHRTKLKTPKGTVLLLPGGKYESLNVNTECTKATKFLNEEGYDAAVLEYHIAPAMQSRDSALMDALMAFKLLKSNHTAFGMPSEHLEIMGIAAGGHLAARTQAKLNVNEQPDNLILISPTNLEEKAMGTVFPAVMPPLTPKARLFVSFSANDNKAMITVASEFAKTWKGYDGQASFSLTPDSAYVSGSNTDPFDSRLKLPGLLKDFLKSKPEIKDAGPNPAAIAVEGYSKKRHTEKLEEAAKDKYDLIMLGNSITNNFDKPEYQPVWNQFFAPRKALNLGFSGYRTENIIWNIEHDELEGQSPKVLVLEIGTNNIDEVHYPIRHTAGQLAGGMEAIVKLVRQKLPDTKIIILRCFPGCYGGANPTSHRAILERASDLVSKLADGKNIFYCDVNHVFLNFDGSINHDLMPDYLHPNPDGAKLWAQAMEPLLSQLMGDKSLDTGSVKNTAITPVPKLENDSYNWYNRHAEVLRVKDSISPEVVLIGNSITHFWGGEPKLIYADGSPRKPNGPNAWASVFGKYRVLNLGFGWDRTQNVLWRLDHGELDGLHPRKVVIEIGTNNTSQTENARINTAPEIVEGIRAICLRIRSKVPGAKIVLMALLPREKDPTNPRRLLINEINKALEAFAKEQQLTYVDVGAKFLAPDGTFLPGMMLDYTHPTDKGYQVWADGIRAIIDKP